MISVTLVLEKIDWKEHNICAMDLGGPIESDYQPLQNKTKQEYFNSSLGANDKHNPLSCHHKANGRGILIPVGDISRTENRGGGLG